LEDRYRFEFEFDRDVGDRDIEDEEAVDIGETEFW
jgi:hypothetical protein